MQTFILTDEQIDAVSGGGGGVVFPPTVFRPQN
jgi:hypothetical protein